jgi:hypothetical protein
VAFRNWKKSVLHPFQPSGELDIKKKLANIANVETTVLKAKNSLSLLLRKAEKGEEVLIRRGSSGTRFRIVRVEEPVKRTLEPDPRWKNRIAFKDEDVWESEWKEEE